MNEYEPAYCHSIESYLCRKNDGHLIRIVGPAFERVCQWEEQGIPLKVAFRGIDRYFERYYAKGPRRRPVRVEFCEADVLDVFDEWRRAVGVSLVRERPPSDEADGEASPQMEPDDLATATRPKRSMRAHLDRVMARLIDLRTSDDDSLHPALDEAIRDVDRIRAAARGVRGSAREAVLERLRALDADVIAAARSVAGEAAMEEIRAEARTELEPFRTRMPEEAYRTAVTACENRIIRERARLPVIAFE